MPCPFENIKMPCEKWDWPKNYFLIGGHWLIFNNIRGEAWYQFLGEMGFVSALIILLYEFFQAVDENIIKSVYYPFPVLRAFVVHANDLRLTVA